MSGASVLVLGAGCAGLSAAWKLGKLGRKVVVLERDDHVGGLAGGIRLGGNIYEYGPHVFHTTDPEILADVKALMGEELRPFHRTIKIKFLGNYFSFPLSIPDVLFKLPPTTVLRAGGALVYRLLEGLARKPAVENSETVLIRYYGDVLYEIFFKSYIEQVWGVSPAAFSPAFARERIPRLDLLEVLDRMGAAARARFGGAIRTQGYVEKVAGDLYSTRQGFALITERMAEAVASGGGELRLRTEVVGLERTGERVSAVVVRPAAGGPETRLECSGVINTLPINEAALAFSPGLGAEVEAAARALRFRGTVFVGMKVRRPKVLPASFMYFREHSFNRITDLAYFGHDIEPKGCSLLVAEVNCDPPDPFWTNEQLVSDAVRSDLEREKLLEPGDVLETHIFRSRHAYPVYTLGYEEFLRALLERFERLENAETAGRQGRFQYVNTHVAMKMGYEAAARLHGRLAS